MKVLITGAAGQLGRELVRHAPAAADVVATDRASLDIADTEAVARIFAEAAPTVVLNAAAYTAVDLAETRPAQAHAANVAGPQNLARQAAMAGARLIHVSSDYVFDGCACSPYPPTALTGPGTAYGRSKRNGELAVLAAGSGALVLRSAWLYSIYGSNFVQTILRQARDNAPLRVVSDQVGSPTWAAGLARVIWQLAARPEATGILHHVDAGVASRYDFAVAIVEEAAARGLLAAVPPVEPISTAQYPTPAVRPAFSVLDCGQTRDLLSLPAVHWRTNLRHMLDELEHPGG